MDECPLCSSAALVEHPDWSGGRFRITCSSCGSYSTNQIVLDEVKRLRAENHPRIGELIMTIELRQYDWYMTWSQQLESIVFEQENQPIELSKLHKKGMRRALEKPHSQVSVQIFNVTKDGDDEASSN